MQDRFKFRVWDKTLKQMHHNDFVVTSTGYVAKLNALYDIEYDNEKDEEKEIKSENEFMIDNSDLDFEKDKILMQCTGLKDKNGKLIYENDIVKTLYTRHDGIVINRNCVVEFNRCAFWINYGIGASYLDNDDCIYEVIGNIYENKDLLND